LTVFPPGATGVLRERGVSGGRGRRLLTRRRRYGHGWSRRAPLGGDFVIVVAHFSHISDFGVVGLTEQAGEPRHVEQRIFPAMHRDHPEAQGFLAHGRAKLG
jgi:hypothetical protein